MTAGFRRIEVPEEISGATDKFSAAFKNNGNSVPTSHVNHSCEKIVERFRHRRVRIDGVREL